MMRRRTMQDMTANCDGMQNQRRDNSRYGWLHNEITTTTTSAENVARSSLVSMDHDLWGGMTMMDEGEEAMVKEETVEKNNVPFDFGDVDSLPRNRNNNNNKSMDLSTSSMQKRVNVRTVINNDNDNVDERETNKRRINDDEGMNNAALSSSFLPIGKVARLEPSEGSAFRRIDAAMSSLSCDGWDRMSENERRLDGGFVLCGVKREKMDESERMSDNATATTATINNNNENLLSNSMTRNDNSENVYATGGSESSRFDSSSSSSSQAIQSHQNEDEINANQPLVQQNDKESDADDDDDDGSSIESYHHLDDIEQEAIIGSENDDSDEGITTKKKKRRRRSETFLNEDGSRDVVVTSASTGLRNKPAGYWDDFSNVEKELRSFIERMGDKIKPGRMPTTKQLRNGGCSNLENAIRKHGGSAAVAERLGLSRTVPSLNLINHHGRNNKDAAWHDLHARSMSVIHAADYWDDFSNIEKDLQSFFNYIGDRIDAGRMPTKQQLIDAGFISLNSALSRHGGSAAVGERLGLAVSSSAARENSADDTRQLESVVEFDHANVHQQLTSVTNVNSEVLIGPRLMHPGDCPRISRLMGEDAVEENNNNNKDNANHPSSLTATNDAREIANASRISDSTKLDNAKLSSLQTMQSHQNENAENGHESSVEQRDDESDDSDEDGSCDAVVSSAALPFRTKSHRYWDDFSNLEKELRSFIERMGDKIKPGTMPTAKQVQNGGCSGLRHPIYKHGGFAAVGERLGLAAPPPKKREGYWDDFSNVDKEVRSLIERMGDKIKPGRMPTKQQLRKEGYDGLRNAIQKHGGLAAVGERLGLSRTVLSLNLINHHGRNNKDAAWHDLHARSISVIHAADYWDDFSNIEKDLQSFFNLMGDKIEPGRMPTKQQLLDAGFVSLNSALSRHGGSAAVAERLGLALPS